MQRRLLSNSLPPVSPIAFGSFKIGRNQKTKYDQAYPLPTEEETSRLLNGVLDLGINLIDTAPAYGLAEERIGRHLAHRRQEFLLSTKVGETFEDGQSTYDFSKAALIASIERSLQRLRSDVLDILLIHSNGQDLEILDHSDAPAALLQAKHQGKTRLIGLSGKTPEGARKAMEWADLLMIEYHPQDRSHELVVKQAAERRIGVMIKKPLASGKIPAQEAIPFVLSNPAVATLVIGGLSLDHIRENLTLAGKSAQ